MKRNILLTVFTVLSLGVGVAVFAYSSTLRATDSAESCCPKGADSCPMKMKHDGQTTMNHDSCPMKTKDSSGNASAASCDNCDCCKGDSCPMKHNKGDAAKTSADADKNPDGTAASCDCPCCHHDQQKNDGDTAI